MATKKKVAPSICKADGYSIERTGNRTVCLTLTKSRIVEDAHGFGKKVNDPVCVLHMTYGGIVNLVNKMNEFDRKADEDLCSLSEMAPKSSGQHYRKKNKKL